VAKEAAMRAFLDEDARRSPTLRFVPAKVSLGRTTESSVVEVEVDVAGLRLRASMDVDAFVALLRELAGRGGC
jgi:hypothetical protein